MRSSSSPRRSPSRSARIVGVLEGILPAITPEPIMAGWKRAPSSLVKMAMATGCRVSIFRSFGSNGLERAQHTELSVVLAPGGTGVGVRAHQDGRPAVPPPDAARRYCPSDPR